MGKGGYGGGWGPCLLCTVVSGDGESREELRALAGASRPWGHAQGARLQTTRVAPRSRGASPFPVSSSYRGCPLLLPEGPPAFPLFSVLQEASRPRLPCQVAFRWLS